MQEYPAKMLPRQYAPESVREQFKRGDERFMSGFRQWLRNHGIYLTAPHRIKEARSEVEALASQSGCQYLLGVDLDPMLWPAPKVVSDPFRPLPN